MKLWFDDVWSKFHG